MRRYVFLKSDGGKDEAPVRPLSSDEFTAVASILQREHGVGDGWRYASIEMVEPSKAELRAFDDGGERRRLAAPR